MFDRNAETTARLVPPLSCDTVHVGVGVAQSGRGVIGQPEILSERFQKQETVTLGEALFLIDQV